MRILCLALLSVLAIASCRPEDGGVSGVYQTTKENGAIIPLVEGESCTDPNVRDGEMCIAPYQSTDTLGLYLNEAENLDFAANLFFFNGHSCSIDGTAAKYGNGWSYESNEYGENCKLVFTTDGEKISIVIPQGFSCTSYCGARGTLDGTEFPLSSKIDFKVASKKDFACLVDMADSCPWAKELEE